MLRRVTVYVAADCSLCAAAVEVVREVQAEIDFDLELVDVAGDPELELAHRERLPVVAIDGRPAFTYFVEPDAFRDALRH